MTVRNLLCASALLFVALPCAGQAPTEYESARVAKDVQGIHQALDRLVGLLESVQRQQSLELLLKRIEMHERRQAPLERRLRSAENDVENLQDEIIQLDVMWAQQEEQYEEELQEGGEVSASARRRMRNEFERMKIALESRADEARLRVQRAEDDLIDGREEIEILDEKLMERLDSE